MTIEALTMQLGEEQLAKLRAIRLYHWRERGHWRRVEAQSKDPKFAALAGQYASWHIGAVQSLNDFFPDHGDTAEHDEYAAQQEPGK